MKIVIIGGNAGGASAATRLRRLNEHAEIVLLEKGEYVSYASCGLPYYIGNVIKEKNNLTVQTPHSLESRFHIDVRINSEAIAIDHIAKTVSIKNLQEDKTYQESYDKLIISTGAIPIKPNFPGVDNEHIFTLRDIADMNKIKEFIDVSHPQKAIIVGGGYIGVELAENLSTINIDVTIIELKNHIINSIDSDVACFVENYLKNHSIHVITSNGVNSFSEKENKIYITLGNGDIVEADFVILSIGVTPNSSIFLHSGIEMNSRNAIVVNSHMETSIKDIYAIGDVTSCIQLVTGAESYIPLAGPANKQGRIVADNICGIPTEYKQTQGSSILKIFDMVIASTGINEELAELGKISYDKAYILSSSHATYYPNAKDIFIKGIFEKETGKILGAQMIGIDGVDKLADVLSTAIRAHMTAKDLTELELCYAPPFSSAKSPINMLGYVIENLVTGKVKQFHYNDLKNLPRDGSVNLVDVRTPKEYSLGHIEGFINIPVDDLRDNLNKLDKTKPVYLYCRSALRSYIASRIFMQNGFDCYHLSGGYYLYRNLTQ